MGQKKYAYFFGNGKAGRKRRNERTPGWQRGWPGRNDQPQYFRSPGFTITTEACVEYFHSKKRFPPGMWDQAIKALRES